MKIVYFSHSYRAEDRNIVAYFGSLLEGRGLIISLDPPSNAVNGAKLERHLASTDGMVAVFTKRPDGYSKHILYEAHMCLRARKPLLAFIEDILPDDILPSRVLQIRFSRRSFLRQSRDHMHAVRQLIAFIGEQPPPRYSLAGCRRCCGLTGLAILSDAARRAVFAAIEEKGYVPVEIDLGKGSYVEDLRYGEAVTAVGLGIHFVDAESARSHYAVGICDGLFVPTIRITSDPGYPFSPAIPREYQPRLVNLQEITRLVEAVNEEVDITEQDFVDLENQEEVVKYADLLITREQTQGAYTDLTRSLFVRELNMGDKFQIGRIEQAAALGSHAQANNVNFVKVEQGRGDFDLKALALELEHLGVHLQRDADPGTLVEITLVEQAAGAAREGNRARALAFLAKLGRGTLHVAASVGYHIAAAAIAHAAGLMPE